MCGKTIKLTLFQIRLALSPRDSKIPTNQNSRSFVFKENTASEITRLYNNEDTHTEASQMIRGIRGSSGKWSPFHLFLNFAGCYAALNVFSEHFYTVLPSSGPSMYPTLRFQGEALLISKLYKYGKGVGVGDMIIIRHPYFLHSHAGKRVLGMPGDYVLKSEPSDTVRPEDVEMIQVRIYPYLYSQLFFLSFFLSFWSK